MKKTFMPIAIIFILTAMSFTTSESKFKIVKTENKERLTNVDLLSLEDLEKIEKITTIGANTTDYIHKSIKDNWINETIKTHTDPKLKQEANDKLNSILDKY